jgi:hypothetical protein
MTHEERASALQELRAAVRAAIALAQGWQLARGIKLLGISSVAVKQGNTELAIIDSTLAGS